MAWDLTIIRGTPDNRLPLGERDAVIAHLAAVSPELEPRVAPAPPPELLQMMPESMREMMTQPMLTAEYDTDEVAISLRCLDQPVIPWINLEVRGGGNAQPLLANICRRTGWTILDAADKTPVAFE